MAKVKCKCGNTISNGSSPSHHQAWLFSDETKEKVIMEDKIIDAHDDCIDLWECVECGRIAFGNRNDDEIVWYTPDAKPQQTLAERADGLGINEVVE